MNHKLYFEEIIEGSHEYMVVSSKVTPATKAQIKKAQEEFKAGKCKHQIIYDEAGWLYDVRSCGICGVGLGLI